MTHSPLSKLADSLIGSEIVKLGNMIRARKAAGETIYNFTIGDFDPNIFPIPNQLKASIIQAYQNNQTSYPLADGELDLRQAIADFYAANAGFNYGVNEIQIASGGRPIIYSIFRVLVDEGDTVVYAAPSWNNNHYTHMNWAKHCVIETTPENDFMPTAADIAPHIETASLICLCSPQNPTGTMLKPDELKKIGDMIVAENIRRGPNVKKLYLLFDQMYWTLVYNNNIHGDPVQLVPEMRNYTLYVDGISKCFAATGVRVGWSFGPAPIIAKIKAILSHLGAWAPMAEQKAVAEYLPQQEAIDAYMATFKVALQYRLETIYAGLMQLNSEGFKITAIAPKAAIYLTVKIDYAGAKKQDETTLANQAEVTQYLLEEAGLAIVPFYAFGAQPNSAWYRMSIGTCKQEDIEPMLAKLKIALSTLN